jgi:hypothetical protein
MKRTTLVLDDDLYAALKTLAVREGRTLTEIVERTLRAGLQRAAAGRGARITLPSYDLGPFLVDPGDREHGAALLAPPPEDRG